MFKFFDAWLDQAEAQLESWAEGFRTYWAGFPARWEESKYWWRFTWTSIKNNWVWLKNQTKLVATIILVGVLVVLSWAFGWAGAGNSQFQISNLEWFLLLQFTIGSVAIHRFIVGRTWWRSIGLTIIELAAWFLARVFFQNQRYAFMLTRWEATVRLAVAWIIGLVAWATRGKWTFAIDAFFWRLRLLAELWQTLYTFFPFAKYILNGAVFLGGAAVFFGGLLQNSWLWVVILPLLFVWLTSALLKPPTTEEKIQRVEKLAAQKAGITLPKKGHGGAHQAHPAHAGRPEDDPEIYHRPPRH